jgi:hypothetical protein
MTQAQAGTVTIRIDTLISDFDNVDISATSRFSPQTDGIGPYFIHANNASYQFLEVQVTLEQRTAPRQPLSFLKFATGYIGNVTFGVLG